MFIFVIVVLSILTSVAAFLVQVINIKVTWEKMKNLVFCLMVLN